MLDYVPDSQDSSYLRGLPSSFPRSTIELVPDSQEAVRLDDSYSQEDLQHNQGYYTADVENPVTSRVEYHQEQQEHRDAIPDVQAHYSPRSTYSQDDYQYPVDQLQEDDQHPPLQHDMHDTPAYRYPDHDAQGEYIPTHTQRQGSPDAGYVYLPASTSYYYAGSQHIAAECQDTDAFAPMRYSNEHDHRGYVESDDSRSRWQNTEQCDARYADDIHQDECEDGTAFNNGNIYKRPRSPDVEEERSKRARSDNVSPHEDYCRPQAATIGDTFRNEAPAYIENCSAIDNFSYEENQSPVSYYQPSATLDEHDGYQQNDEVHPQVPLSIPCSPGDGEQESPQSPDPRAVHTETGERKDGATEADEPYNQWRVGKRPGHQGSGVCKKRKVDILLDASSKGKKRSLNEVSGICGPVDVCCDRKRFAREASCDSTPRRNIAGLTVNLIEEALTHHRASPPMLRKSSRSPSDRLPGSSSSQPNRVPTRHLPLPVPHSRP
jgi:hypothetical protein